MLTFRMALHLGAGCNPRRCADAPLEDGLTGASGVCGEVEGLGYFLLARLQPCGFADVDGAAVATLHRRGDALLGRKDLAKRVPGVVNTTCFQFQAQGMNKIIGQQAYE